MAGLKLNTDPNGPILIEDDTELLVGATPVSFSPAQLEPIIKMLLTASPIALAIAKQIHLSNPLLQAALDQLPLCVSFLQKLDEALKQISTV
jgi:hypothetical protein